MMKRKQYKDLVDWKDRGNHKPLVIRGARQVGKTFLVREFGQNEFEHFLEVNFDETPAKGEFFFHDDIEQILKFLSLDTGVPVIPGKTLIFLDEIQRVPEVFARLRYFYEKKESLHIIAAGSLLDFTLADHSFSMPVGRIEYLFMGPMDFKEFLLAGGEGALVDYINTCEVCDGIPDIIHEKLLDRLRVYMTVGGMPAAIKTYFQSDAIELCERELSTIIYTYRDDFSKYRERVNTTRLQNLLDRIPGIIGRKVKYSEINRDEKSRDIKNDLSLLERARIIYRVYHSSANGIPLRAEKKERDYKLVFLDIGLMMRSMGLNLLDIQKENLILSNKGALAEQFVGQQLLSHQKRYNDPELFYWNREQKGTSSEVDYLIQKDGRIVPVEVKSGKTGSLKSLHVFVSEKNSTQAVRFNLDKPSLTDVISRVPGREEHPFALLSLPLYLVSEWERLL